MKKCKVCGVDTEVIFNINFKATPICEDCATSIFLQQARYYSENRSIYNLPRTIKKEPKRHPEIAVEILNYLNETLGKRKRYTTDEELAEKTTNLDTVPEVFLAHISARVEEGHSLRKMKAVIHLKHKEWGKDPKMKQYLRPATLFNREKFNTYVLEIPEDWNPDNSREQREILRELSNYGMRGIRNEETDKLAKKLMQTGYKKKEVLNLYLTKKI